MSKANIRPVKVKKRLFSNVFDHSRQMVNRNNTFFYLVKSFFYIKNSICLKRDSTSWKPLF